MNEEPKDTGATQGQPQQPPPAPPPVDVEGMFKIDREAPPYQTRVEKTGR